MGQKHSSHQRPQKQPSVEVAEEAVEIVSDGETEDNAIFSFLMDDDTIYYFKRSRIMIILRGLPGSGKTYLAAKMKEKYGNYLDICSADHYFEQSGTYHFDKMQLKDAHQYSRNKALKLCKQGKPIVVIDNTNVCLWEMEYYIDLAQKSGYIQLFVEPRTSWKYNADVLATKNVHGIGPRIIEKRLDQWEKLTPMYFGWFLNPCDSINLYDLSAFYLESCMKVSKFEQEFQKHLSERYCKDLLEYFGINFRKSSCLHCTSKYCAKQPEEGEEYLQKAVANMFYGKTFTLEIIGFIITSQTFGARVKLNFKQLQLWDQDDNEAPAKQNSTEGLSSDAECSDRMVDSALRGVSSVRRGGGGYASQRNFHHTVPHFTPPDPFLCYPTLRSVQEKTCKNLNRTEGFGSRAHITLGRAGVSAVQTGYDLMEIIKLEISATKQKSSVNTFNILGGTLRQYQENYWMLYLEKSLLVDSVFAFYAKSQ